MKWSILKLNDKESCRSINLDEIGADIVVDHAAILIGEGAPHVQDSVLLNVTQLSMSFEATVDVQLSFCFCSHCTVVYAGGSPSESFTSCH